MAVVETQMFKKGLEEKVSKALDNLIGTDFEFTYCDTSGDFSVSVFDVETKKDFASVMEIEDRFKAYDAYEDNTVFKHKKK